MFKKSVLALFLLQISVSTVASDTSLPTREIRLADRVYRVEIAANSAQRGLGLMFREHLADDRGMLLVYPESADHRIWMKNMRIPIRVYWIDENGRVVDLRRLEPCRSSPCPVYAADGHSRFVLELNDTAHPIRRGDRIEGLSD